jgi:tetratricopeptide (TPR) repeat protein
VRTYTRHQLKQDQFAEATRGTLSWAVVHRQKLVIGGIIAAVVLAVVLGGWAWYEKQQQQSGIALARALNTYNAPLRPAGTPATSEMLTFTSAAERARVAHNEFQKIASDYSHAQAGHVARYFAGLTALDMGDAAAGEKELKEVADSSDADIAALAKMALATRYRNSGRAQDAIRLYKEVAEHPTRTVSKAQAQLELAGLYEAAGQTADANKVYQEIAKDDPASPAAQLASSRLKAK